MMTAAGQRSGGYGAAGTYEVRGNGVVATFVHAGLGVITCGRRGQCDPWRTNDAGLALKVAEALRD